MASNDFMFILRLISRPFTDFVFFVVFVFEVFDEEVVNIPSKMFSKTCFFGSYSQKCSVK
jgi:hypothetical protein